MRYIDGATIDDCKNALRQGATLQTLGERLGIDPAELARIIGVPVVKPAEQPADYLWSVERGESQL